MLIEGSEFGSTVDPETYGSYGSGSETLLTSDPLSVNFHEEKIVAEITLIFLPEASLHSCQ
jgi:hypothetical protein